MMNAVGIDVSKRKSTVTILRPGDDVVLDPVDISHTRSEIDKLIGLTKEKGATLVPLKVYINRDGRAKMELAVARGKKLYDKRQAIAKRDADMKMRQAKRR